MAIICGTSQEGTLSALFIETRMKNLTHLEIHNASFEEKSLLSRALLLRSVQHLTLRSFVGCTVACLIRITKACPQLSVLKIYSDLDDPGQILPQPRSLHKYPLVYLYLCYDPNASRFIDWYIREGTFLANLTELSLIFLGSNPYKAISAAYFDSMRALLDHCKHTLEILRMDFYATKLEDGPNICMFYTPARPTTFSCSYS